MRIVVHANGDSEPAVETTQKKPDSGTTLTDRLQHRLKKVEKEAAKKAKKR